LTLDFTHAEPWYAVLPELPGPLTELTGIFHGQPSEAVRAEWLAHTPASAPLDRVQRAPGVVPAKIGTIAGSKGETHSATLLLECVNRAGRKHDLVPVLPLILGSTDIASASASDRQAAQLAFVAVTRPRYLLALAMHEDRVAMHRRHSRPQAGLFGPLQAACPPAEPLLESRGAPQPAGQRLL
jgi:DNA helicase-2/ATP-dependent DNA helicase PcrA